MSLSLLDELILEPRTCTSKNLTVQSLFETTSCGSALLAQDLVSSTELLIEDPKSCVSWVQIGRECRWRDSDDDASGCIERWRSASWPPAAIRVCDESGIGSAARVFGVNGRFAIARFEPGR